MKIVEQNRKKPVVGGEYFVVAIVGGFTFVSCIISFPLIHVFNKNLWISVPVSLLVAIGVGLLLWILMRVFSPTGERYRPSVTTTATITRRYREERESSYGEPYQMYFFVLEYLAQGTGKAKGSGVLQSTFLSEDFDLTNEQVPINFVKINLRASVSKRIYGRFNTGDPIPVRYASGDPCIALIEGEF